MRSLILQCGLLCQPTVIPIKLLRVRTAYMFFKMARDPQNGCHGRVLIHPLDIITVFKRRDSKHRGYWGYHQLVKDLSVYYLNGCRTIHTFRNLPLELLAHLSMLYMLNVSEEGDTTPSAFQYLWIIQKHWTLETTHECWQSVPPYISLPLEANSQS